ncbi:MAG: SDR family NAD(P)-dependent oxidoreductase [Thiotrichaceae bacterium]
MNSTSQKKIAIVAGAGADLGIALCKRLIKADYLVAGLSRSAEPQDSMGESYLPIACDLTDNASVDAAITEAETRLGEASVYIHNAASLLRNEFLATTSADFVKQWNVTCLGAVNGIQRILPSMLVAKSGTILVTGATASIKAGAGFSAFSSAKFALRGLTQSLAREYSPQGIHIAHILVDGAIWGWQAEHKFDRDQHDCLQPEAVAETYLHLINQHRSAWTHELDLRPDIESF